ncbi:hypothetical protein [Tritonibacter mobilis]|uniref:hypothetical protein n=1 Tax=Tritonibacter mobilis TaxID=379347 RepID=UPI00080697DA|nr:hypothetical protein [Tritonibacter mobilis]GLP84648.1 hypothetical protein GCM10007921_02080 [Tritonibacter mobilis]SDW07903.1 hypothetical protein SAMN05444385_101206 [Tritonibacter mobilis]
MSRSVAICILAAFSSLGIAVAIWGLWDISAALNALSACAERVYFDTSSFWFLALAVLPLFLLLAPLSKRHHARLLAGIVALAFLLPAAGFWVLKRSSDAQGYVFAPELALFSLQETSATPAQSCRP